MIPPDRIEDLEKKIKDFELCIRIFIHSVIQEKFGNPSKWWKRQEPTNTDLDQIKKSSWRLYRQKKETANKQQIPFPDRPVDFLSCGQYLPFIKALYKRPSGGPIFAQYLTKTHMMALELGLPEITKARNAIAHSHSLPDHNSVLISFATKLMRNKYSPSPAADRWN